MTMAMPELAGGVMLVVVDVQERLVRAMPGFEAGPAQAATLKALRAAGALGLDVVVTEQYPQGLGPTLPAVRAALPAAAKVLAKTTFSCWGDPGFAAAVEAVRPAALLLLGMETHVCVQQTALDSLARGYRPVLLADAVVSRQAADRELALAFLRHAGVAVTSVEAAFFQLLRDAKHPAFKAVSAVFKG
ncbi:MAG: isochorismatase family protein [Lentisphaeria bacterium]|jgi:nicotinamidase-related amidase